MSGHQTNRRLPLHRADATRDLGPEAPRTNRPTKWLLADSAPVIQQGGDVAPSLVPEYPGTCRVRSAPPGGASSSCPYFHSQSRMGLYNRIPCSARADTLLRCLPTMLLIGELLIDRVIEQSTEKLGRATETGVSNANDKTNMTNTCCRKGVVVG